MKMFRLFLGFLIVCGILTVACEGSFFLTELELSTIGLRWKVKVDPDTLKPGQLVPIGGRFNHILYPWQGEKTLRFALRRRILAWNTGTLSLNGRIVGFVEDRNYREDSPCNIPSPKKILIFVGSRLPKELKKCPNLVYISLAHSLENDSTLEFIRDAKGLRVLMLEYADVSDKGGIIIASFDSLEVLEVHFSAVSDDVLDSMANLRNLKKLQLGGGVFTEEGFRNWENMAGLDELHLDWCSVPETGYKYLSRLPALTRLEICSNELTDEGAKLVSEVDNLGYLVLSGDEITDEGIQYLAALPNISYLYIESKRITDEANKYFLTQPQFSGFKISFWPGTLGNILQVEDTIQSFRLD